MAWQDNWKKDKLGGSIMSTLGAMSPGITSLIDGYNTDVSNIENQLDLDIKRLKAGWDGVSADSMDDLMSQQASYRNIDTAYNAKDKYNVPSIGDIWSNALTNGITSAASSASLGPWASAATGIFNLAGSLIGGYKKRNTMNDAINKADSTYATEANRQNAYRQASFQTAADKLATKDNRMLMTQMSTHGYGGPLGISLLPVGGAIDYMQNEELLTSLNDGMNKNSNKKVPMPVFAFGGALGGYGGNWDSGLTYIGSGGSHEQNPFGGVPAGIAEDGEENKVEEGEWIWKDQDYVFSARLHVPEDDYEALGLRKRKEGYTYAQAAESGQKESSERPNDAISKKGKEAFLTKLMQSQEKVREEKMIEEQYNQQMKNIAAYAAKGGGLSGSKDYGSKKKPYPKVKSSDFAGGGRSYPIPTKADAVDALRLAGLHHRPDVKAKVYKKYPELKHALGGHLFYAGGPDDPLYNWQLLQEADRGMDLDLFSKVLNTTNYDDTWNVSPKVHTFLDSYYDTSTLANPGISQLGYPRANAVYNTAKPLTSQEGRLNWLESTSPYIDYPFYWSDEYSDYRTRLFNTDRTKQPHIPSLSSLDIKRVLPEDSLKPSTKNPNFNISLQPQSITVDDLAKSLEAANKSKGSFDPLPTTGWQTDLRYAPILGPMLAIGHSLFNKPDYEYANTLSDLAKSYKSQIHHNITPEYLGDYLAYNPFDRLFYANELGAQQAANRSAIMNAGNANKGATMMALLGNGYNDNIGQGRLFREGEEYNLAQRQKVAEFNRATDQYNSQARLNADIANMSERNKGLTTALRLESEALKMKQAEDAAYWSGLMSNLSNTFQSMGNIGNEAEQRYWLNALINSGILGTPNESMLDIAYGKKRTANGGKLNKKKRGLTI